MADLYGGISPYSFGFNSPTNFNDPSGLFPWDGFGGAAIQDGGSEIVRSGSGFGVKNLLTGAGVAAGNFAINAGFNQLEKRTTNGLVLLRNGSTIFRPSPRPTQRIPQGRPRRSGATNSLSTHQDFYGAEKPLKSPQYRLPVDTKRPKLNKNQYENNAVLEDADFSYQYYTYEKYSEHYDYLVNNSTPLDPINLFTGRSNRNERGVQYFIVAKIDGKYPLVEFGISQSPLDGGFTTKWVDLKAGEIWKIGETLQYDETTNKQWRYTEKALKKYNLIFKPKYLGTKKEIQAAEKSQLFFYKKIYEKLPAGNAGNH